MLKNYQLLCLPHPATCPHCDQEDETIDHLLTNCVFARQFWFNLLQQFSLHNLAPLAQDKSLDGWWNRESLKVHDLAQRGFNSLVILGAWTLWKHRNSCVFEGAAPNLARALLLAKEEAVLWSLAGARGISFLSALEPGRIAVLGRFLLF